MELEKLQCECCKYIPTEEDMDDETPYELEICPECGKKVCGQCLLIHCANNDDTIDYLMCDDEEEAKAKYNPIIKCRICSGDKPEEVKETGYGFYKEFMTKIFDDEFSKTLTPQEFEEFIKKKGDEL